MAEVHVLAIDLAKRSFQVRGIARGGVVLFNRTVSRSKFEQLLRGLTPRIVRRGQSPYGRISASSDSERN